MAIFNKIMNESLGSFVLFSPPALEESLLYISNLHVDPKLIREFSLRIKGKSTNYGIENITNLLLVKLVENSGYLHVILVCCCQPPRIVVGMSMNPDVDNVGVIHMISTIVHVGEL